MNHFSIAMIIVAIFTFNVVTIVCNVVVTTAIKNDESVSKTRQRDYVFSISYFLKTFNFIVAQNVFVKELCRFTKKKMFQILSHIVLKNIRFRIRYVVFFEMTLTMFCARLFYFERLKTLMHNFDYNRF